MNTTTKVFTLDTTGVELAASEIEKINKRAAKIGIGAVVMQVEDAAPRESASGLRYAQFTVTITAAAVKVAGYTFIAKIERLEDNTALTHSLIDGVLPLDYATVNPSWCDHCGVNRRRTISYVLQHEDGTLKQVGTACIRDFIGYDAQALAAHLESMNGLWHMLSDSAAGGDPDAEDFGPRGRGTATVWLESLIKTALREVNAHGWLSKSKAEETGGMSTFDRVMSRYADRAGTMARPSAADMAYAEEHADKVIAFVRDELSGDSEYTQNLKTIYRTDEITYKHIGLAISGIACYLNEQRRAAERAAVNNAHLGEVDKKLTVEATCAHIHAYETGYGVSLIISFVTDSGEMLIWKTSSGDAVQGTRYTVAGKVKAHDEYRGRKQTVLTRCKLTAIDA